MVFTLTSGDFAANQPIPVRHSRGGGNVSPGLAWDDTPPGTRTLALIMDDPDVIFRSFTHWVVFNIPGTLASLPAGLARGDLPEATGIQGRNDFGETGYGGPQPPSRKLHHYRFTLYALDTTLPLRTGATKRQVLDAMKGHILGHTELIGTYANDG